MFFRQWMIDWFESSDFYGDSCCPMISVSGQDQTSHAKCCVWVLPLGLGSLCRKWSLFGQGADFCPPLHLVRISSRSRLGPVSICNVLALSVHIAFWHAKCYAGFCWVVLLTRCAQRFGQIIYNACSSCLWLAHGVLLPVLWLVIACIE